MTNSYVLKIFVKNRELFQSYEEHIINHINRMNQQGSYADSGFDLLVSENINEEVRFEPLKIDMGISCAMFRTNSYSCDEPCGFYLYPRSSLYKYNLRLTNSVGIIDSGYRGNLSAIFDIVGKNNYIFIPQYSRLVQICTPDLSPIRDVRLVSSIEELGITVRGDGGFGSTG